LERHRTKAGNYSDLAKDVDKRVGTLFKAAPKPMGAYSQLAQAASSDGAIEAKIKELMALAISVASRCEDCITYDCRGEVPDVERRLSTTGERPYACSTFV